jgi:hypothetical protein
MASTYANFAVFYIMDPFRLGRGRFRHYEHQTNRWYDAGLDTPLSQQKSDDWEDLVSSEDEDED